MADASDSPAERDAPFGRAIQGRFRVERVLGSGGMGEVLLAHDTLLNRRVAIKRLHAGGDHDPRRRSSLLREARRASQISDPRIAAIHDVLELEDDLLIVMEFVDGVTLRDRAGQPMPLAEFWTLAAECIGGLAAAHAGGIIHRDIKPENLMVTADGRVKILDFGIAGRLHPPVEGTVTPGAFTTTTEAAAKVFAGTPPYMAPEAHLGGTVDQRTDVFALGTVFYELLAGQHPFAGPTYDVVFRRIMSATPTPLRTLNPDVPPALSALVAKMMAKDPSQRPSSCRELMREFQAVRAGLETMPAAGGAVRTTAVDSGQPQPIPDAGRRWGGWQVAGLALATVAAVSVLAVRGAFKTSLPASLHVAVLPPATPRGSDDFSAFALGATEMLVARLQRHQARSGFQIASFQEGVEEKVGTAEEARMVLGANLALRSTMEQRPAVFWTRLELWDTTHPRVIDSRTVEVSLAEPFRYLDRLYGASADLLGLRSRSRETAAELGVRGAGTLRFMMQGIGRMRRAQTEGEARRAVDDMELARLTEPEAPAVQAWLAAALLRCHELTGEPAWLDRAEVAGRDAVRADSARAEAQRFLGGVLTARKDAAGALVHYRRAAALHPEDDVVAYRLGRAYARLGDTEMEGKTYRGVIERRPHCWQPHWWLATWEFRRGNVEASIRAYRDMIQRAPDLYRGYASLGGLLVLHGDYSAAIDTLRRSIELRPTKVAFDNLGTAYFNVGDLEKAIEAYNQSFQFGFADYALWLNLGDAYLWLRGRRDQAEDAYAESVRLGRDEMAARAERGRTFDVMIPANLATVFPKLGQPDSARAYLRIALAADGDNPMVQYCAALTEWQLGDKPEALAWLQKAVRGGYPVTWLRDSPIFREWRGEEAFRTIVAGAAARRGIAATEGGRP